MGAYFDYASLTPQDPRTYVRTGGVPLNPSAEHAYGVQAQKMMDEARATIAQSLGLSATAGNTLTVTASGTEANNMVVFGVCERLHAQGRAWHDMHVITSCVEHSSILEPVHVLEKRGVRVTYVGIDTQGSIQVEEVKEALTAHTVLISLHLVHNETGVVQPIEAVVKMVRRTWNHDNQYASVPVPYIHTDAAQASCITVHMPTLGVDMLTLDMGKLYGPRGMGILYISAPARARTALEPRIYGGGQEQGLRSGTEAVPTIIEAAAACTLWQQLRAHDVAHIQALRQQTIDGVRRLFPQAFVIETPRQSAHILNIALPGIDAEVLAFRLDAHGIRVSTKSSCLRDEPGSYTLEAMKHPAPQSALRISFGRFSRPRHVRMLLKMLSPLASLSSL
jgi:cysteine desulfurase